MNPLKDIGEKLLTELLACLEDECAFRKFAPVKGGKTMQMQNFARGRQALDHDAG